MMHSKLLLMYLVMLCTWVGADCTKGESLRSQIVQVQLSMEVYSNTVQCQGVNIIR